MNVKAAALLSSLLLFGALRSFGDSPEAQDSLIKEHGKYSKAYMGDWGALKTGKELAAWDMSKVKLQEVSGESVRKDLEGEREVRISGLRLKVSWKEPSKGIEHKYSKALYYIKKCERVVIEDCAIEFADADYRASSAFYIEDCGQVEIRNVRVAGAAFKPKIRLEGVESYFIDRLEICGLDYGDGEGFKCGEGLFINNGQEWDAAKGKPAKNYFAEGYRCMKWGVVQNSYIHDYVPKEWQNHDGILFHSPGDGIVFNSSFENWRADGAIDLSHRRGDAEYGDRHSYRVERCVFKNCEHIKDPGLGDIKRGHQILWANNVLINTGYTEYHNDNSLWLVNNTWFIDNLKDGSRLSKWFMELRPQRDDPFFVKSNLIVSKLPLKSMFSLQSETKKEGLPNYSWDFNCYCMPAPGDWRSDRSRKIGPLATWDEWRAAGYDANSLWSPNADPAFVDVSKDDFRISPSSCAAGKGSPEFLKPGECRLAVTRDFNGRPRPAKPSCGAFEP